MYVSSNRRRPTLGQRRRAAKARAEALQVAGMVILSAVALPATLFFGLLYGSVLTNDDTFMRAMMQIAGL